MASHSADAKLAVISIDTEVDTPLVTATSARPAILRSALSSKGSSASLSTSSAVANNFKVVGGEAGRAASAKLLPVGVPIQIIPTAAIPSTIPRIISNGANGSSISSTKNLLVSSLRGASTASSSAILQAAAASNRGPTLAVVGKLVAISPRSPQATPPAAASSTSNMVKPAHAATSLPNILRVSATSAGPRTTASPLPKLEEKKAAATNGREEQLESDLAVAECAAVAHEVRDEIEGTTDSNDVAEQQQTQGAQPQAAVDLDALLLPLDDATASTETANDFSDKLKCRVNDLGAIELDEGFGTDEPLADEDDIDLTCQEETPLSPKLKEGSPTAAKASAAAAPAAITPKPRETDILCCSGCGCYGMAGEFNDSESCSVECKRRIKEKIREKEKKERELLVQKQRREAKKKEKQMEKEAAAVTALKQRSRVKCDDDDAVPAADSDCSREAAAERLGKRENGGGRSAESRSAPAEESVDQVGLQRGNRKRKRPKFFDEDATSTRSVTPPAPAPNAGAKATERPWALPKDAEIRLSVFRPTESVSCTESFDSRPLNWKRNSAFLQPLVKGLTTSAVMRWTAEDVAALVSSFPSLDASVAEKLVEQEVDGESFLLLTKKDLLDSLGVKLGQALKLINAIHLIKANA